MGPRDCVLAISWGIDAGTSVLFPQSFSCSFLFFGFLCDICRKISTLRDVLNSVVTTVRAFVAIALGLPRRCLAVPLGLVPLPTPTVTSLQRRLQFQANITLAISYIDRYLSPDLRTSTTEDGNHPYRGGHKIMFCIALVY